MLPEISIIIPTLNEEESLAGTLDSICGQEIGKEILIADGGSSDDTRKIAEARGDNCRVVSCKKQGRAAQMNEAANLAKSEILLFLHADTVLPENCQVLADAVAAVSQHRDVVGGGFERVFDSPSCILGLTCRVGTIRSRDLGIILGDQGIFVRRDVFERLKGFDESLRLGEDLDFSRRMRREGRTVCPPRPGDELGTAF